MRFVAWELVHADYEGLACNAVTRSSRIGWIDGGPAFAFAIAAGCVDAQKAGIDFLTKYHPTLEFTDVKCIHKVYLAQVNCDKWVRRGTWGQWLYDAWMNGWPGLFYDQTYLQGRYAVGNVIVRVQGDGIMVIRGSGDTPVSEFQHAAAECTRYMMKLPSTVVPVRG